MASGPARRALVQPLSVRDRIPVRSICGLSGCGGLEVLPRSMREMRARCAGGRETGGRMPCSAAQRSIVGSNRMNYYLADGRGSRSIEAGIGMGSKVSFVRISLTFRRSRVPRRLPRSMSPPYRTRNKTISLPETNTASGRHSPPEGKLRQALMHGIRSLMESGGTSTLPYPPYCLLLVYLTPIRDAFPSKEVPSPDIAGWDGPGPAGPRPDRVRST